MVFAALIKKYIKFVPIFVSVRTAHVQAYARNRH